MDEQAYDDWYTCVIEHIVRLGEIRISYALNDSVQADKLREYYVNEKKFIYLPYLEEKKKYMSEIEIHIKRSVIFYQSY